jgi:hypothetical protein
MACSGVKFIFTFTDRENPLIFQLNFYLDKIPEDRVLKSIFEEYAKRSYEYALVSVCLFGCSGHSGIPEGMFM